MSEDVHQYKERVLTMRIEELEAEVAELNEHLEKEIDNARNAEAENDELRELLVRVTTHVAHGSGCSVTTWKDGKECECGFLQLLTAIDAAMKSKP